MATPYQYIEKKPQSARTIIGIDYEQFQQLCGQAELYYQEQKEKAEKQKIRVNAKGGGRHQGLTVAEQVCLCLYYLRHHPTFELLGMHFDVSKSTANATFHTWLNILTELLPASLLADVEKGYRDGDEVASELQGKQLLVDSEEQARQRPGDYHTQKNTIPERRNNTPLRIK